MNLNTRIFKFTGQNNTTECLCDHKLLGTGAVFFQSVGLLFCANCTGWQLIRKPIK